LEDLGVEGSIECGGLVEDFKAKVLQSVFGPSLLQIEKLYCLPSELRTDPSKHLHKER